MGPVRPHLIVGMDHYGRAVLRYGELLVLHEDALRAACLELLQGETAVRVRVHQAGGRIDQARHLGDGH